MAEFPRLVADVGGTNARFALEVSPMELVHTKVLPCKDYLTLLAAIEYYLAEHEAVLSDNTVEHFVIAIANPVNGDEIKMTNHHWQFSIAAMKAELTAKTLLLINDFSAQALAITELDDEYLTSIAGTAIAPEKRNTLPVAVVGPGTGLGVSALIPDGKGNMVALAGEGGHVAFSPFDETEREILAYAEQVFDGHVSAERLLQGDGLVLLYDFFVSQQSKASDKLAAKTVKPADVTRGALENNDALCQQVLQRYCQILGGFCADITLVVGGVGGVYICGGIVPRFIKFLKTSDFHQRFVDKGRFKDYMTPIPVTVVNHPYPGLIGAAVALRQHLR